MRINQNHRIIFFTLTLMATLIPLKAFTKAADYTIHQEYTSTRALGMGNAFTAVADDHSALFYNPAALALRKDTQLRLFLRGGLDADVIDFADDVDKADGDEAAMNDVLEKHYGEHMYFRAPTIGGVLARPKWGLAIIPADFSTDIGIQHCVAACAHINAYLDTTIAFGRATMINVPKFKKPLAFGWNAKVIHRAYYNDVVQSAQLATGEDLVELNRATEGATLDLDLGLLYESRRKVDKWWQPTIGLVVRNAVDYGFPVNFGVFNDDPKEPPKLQRRVDLGTKFDLPAFWVFDPKLAVDVRDMGHRNWTPMKGLHAGTELYWKMYNWWKGHWSAGFNQGYWTAGFGARMAVFQLDLATWGEEVGTTDEPRESRRYILEMSLDF